MRTDFEIQQDIVHEIAWEPSLRDADVAVAVRDGVATLAGFARSYSEKWTAERAAEKVRGVRGIANDIAVTLRSESERPDPEIARAALGALKWHAAIPDDRIKVKVQNGWVTLEGSVEWYYQKAAAEQAVRVLTGVLGVSNYVTVEARPVSSDIMRSITTALHRGAQLDAERVSVEVAGHKVVLRGTVRALAEKRDIERVARNAPGVTDVENLVVVDVNVGVPVGVS